MVQYTHRAAGSGNTISTASPIFSNLAGERPHPTTDSFPANAVTRKHRSPQGENPAALRSDIRDGGRSRAGVVFDGPNGAPPRDHIGRSGKDPGVQLNPAVARQITASKNDVWNRRAGQHESYNVRQRPAPYLGGSKKKR
jgi:hypothetical protein